MFFIFLDNCREKLKLLFFYLFGRDNTRLERLYTIPLSTWKTLAKPSQTPDGTFYIFSYENNIVKDALYYSKNKQDKNLIHNVCCVLADSLLEELADRETFDGMRDFVIVPVPTSKQHLHHRGFNPSDLIAKKVSALLELPYEKDLLIKHKDTPPQKTLHKSERLVNVRGSMRLNPDHSMSTLQNSSYIVIDDIVTTGATLAEAKRVLLKNGAKKVITVAVAH